MKAYGNTKKKATSIIKSKAKKKHVFNGSNKGKSSLDVKGRTGKGSY